jgi:hypothetical protein
MWRGINSPHYFSCRSKSPGYVWGDFWKLIEVVFFNFI